MQQSNKLYIGLYVSLLFIMIVSAYWQWSIAITIMACLALISINGVERYKNKIEQMHQQALTENSNNEIEQSVSDMFFELEKTFSYERRVIDNEIKRTTSLLTEAVIGMNDSFQQMKEINDKQHALLSNLNLLQVSSDNDNTKIGEQQSVHQFLGESSTVISDYVNQLTHQMVTNSNLSIATMSDVDKAIDAVDSMVEIVTKNTDITLHLQHTKAIEPLIKSLKSKLTEMISQDVAQIVEKQSKANTMTQRMQFISRTMEQNIASLSAMSNEMDNAMYHAVISLQFEDMTSQALASISSNIEKFDVISQKMNIISQSNEPMLSKFYQIRTICLAVSEQTNHIENHRPVSQVNMEEGEIELF